MNIDELLGSGTATTTEETVSEDTVIATKEELEEIQSKKPKKKKGKPRGGNPTAIGMNGYDLEPGDNTRIMQVNMAIFNMKDIDLTDVEAVENRLNEFFMLYAQADLKPTVAGMALCLNGMRRQQLWAIVNDAPTGGAGYKAALPPEVANTIKKSYILMENMWENYMNSGKINTVSSNHPGKNNIGHEDTARSEAPAGSVAPEGRL